MGGWGCGGGGGCLNLMAVPEAPFFRDFLNFV